MTSTRTIAIFFEEFTKLAQKRIVAAELGPVLGEAVSHVVIKPSDLTPYSHDEDPANQKMLQDIHVKVRYDRHDHYMMMTWDCMEAEFINVIEEGNKL